MPTDTLAGRRILLAEDHPVNREVTVDVLKAVGFEVDCAVDGAEATRMALAGRYDVILMDVQMPIVDGLEAARAIRAALGPALPIIAMTARAFAHDREACLEAGMDDHIAKPVYPPLLYGILRRWIAPALGTPTKPSGLEGSYSIVERLAQLKGFDVETALQNLAYQEDMLRRVLRRFSETYRAGVPILFSADMATAEELRTTCHSIRGACAAIGATRLVVTVDALKAALLGYDGAGRVVSTARTLNKGLIELSATFERELLN